MNWIVSRVKEMSSWSGAALIGLGAMIILGGPLSTCWHGQPLFGESFP